MSYQKFRTETGLYNVNKREETEIPITKPAVLNDRKHILPRFSLKQAFSKIVKSMKLMHVC